MRQAIRILVMDDDAGDRNVVSRALHEAGYHTTGCATGTEALEVAGRFLPDLLVLEMRQGDRLVGPELARRLRTRQQQLLVFVTHDADADHRLAAFAAGADDYVMKPYLMDELLARVQALLRRSGRVTSLVTQVGDLIVDEGAHRATFRGTAVALGPIDFALLAVMARHAGQVLSKSRLLELVWGYDTVDENLVEVHVCTLRRGLGEAAAELVQTVRGVGYVVRADRQEVRL